MNNLLDLIISLVNDQLVNFVNQQNVDDLINSTELALLDLSRVLLYLISVLLVNSN